MNWKWEHWMCLKTSIMTISFLLMSSIIISSYCTVFPKPFVLHSPSKAKINKLMKHMKPNQHCCAIGIGCYSGRWWLHTLNDFSYIITHVLNYWINLERVVLTHHIPPLQLRTKVFSANTHNIAYIHWNGPGNILINNQDHLNVHIHIQHCNVYFVHIICSSSVLSVI